MKVVTPWAPVDKQRENLVGELEREVNDRHVLWGRRMHALARRTDSDDVLFEIEGDDISYAVVHLTWSGKQETDPRWPHVQLFSSLESWASERMMKDLEFQNREE
jgi:hypothetical protein